MTAPTTTPGLVVTEPGVYEMSNEEYHRDPVPEGSLSSSGARKLLPPSCPAKFKWERDHGQPPKPEFDFGTAAHKEVLGEGPEIVELEYDSWRTKAVNEEADEARARGAVPLLAKDYAKVKEMAAALRAHPIAGPLFTPGTGIAERAIFWRDERTGIWRRVLADWLKTSGPRTIVVDYKTTTSVEPSAIAKTVQDYGYHMQAEWYLDGVRAAGLGDDDTEFVFVFQEKQAPYLITVGVLDDNARMLGEAKNRRAIETYARCAATDTWPGYADGQITDLTLPPWAAVRDSEEYL